MQILSQQLSATYVCVSTAAYNVVSICTTSAFGNNFVRKPLGKGTSQFNSISVHQHAGTNAKVPIIKPAQEHKYDTKQYKYTKTKH
jgi:hypothetical protein